MNKNPINKKTAPKTNTTFVFIPGGKHVVSHLINAGYTFSMYQSLIAVCLHGQK